jgi:hypothetical protein
VALAIVVGLSFAAYQDSMRVGRTDVPPSDLTQPRLAGQLLLEGRNPYREIGPDRGVYHQFYLIYPATAAAVTVPLSMATARTANAAFVAVGAALLFLALTRKTLRNPQLVVFASLPMISAAQTAQWSPMLTAAIFYPVLGFLYACKPSIALAYAAAYPRRLTFVSAAVLTILTVIVWPWWPGEWLAQLSTVSHMSAPITRTGGPLLLLALFRWRRPEARLLVGLSCIPQTPVMYEALPLFLIVTRMEEALILLFVTHLMGAVLQGATALSYDDWMSFSGQWMIWLVYLPALAMVLRRPNVAPSGDGVEQTVHVVREWLVTALSAEVRKSDA